jgi:hypothetical protein
MQKLEIPSQNRKPRKLISNITLNSSHYAKTNKVISIFD